MKMNGKLKTVARRVGAMGSVVSVVDSAIKPNSLLFRYQHCLMMHSTNPHDDWMDVGGVPETEQ